MLKLKKLEYPDIVGAKPDSEVIWLKLAAELDVSYT